MPPHALRSPRLAHWPQGDSRAPRRRTVPGTRAARMPAVAYPWTTIRSRTTCLRARSSSISRRITRRGRPARCPPRRRRRHRERPPPACSPRQASARPRPRSRPPCLRPRRARSRRAPRIPSGRRRHRSRPRASGRVFSLAIRRPPRIPRLSSRASRRRRRRSTRRRSMRFTSFSGSTSYARISRRSGSAARPTWGSTNARSTPTTRRRSASGSCSPARSSRWRRSCSSCP